MLGLPHPWAGGSPPKSRYVQNLLGPLGGEEERGEGVNFCPYRGVIQGHVHLSKCQILHCLELGGQFGVVVGGFLAVWEGGDAQLQYRS